MGSEFAESDPGEFEATDESAFPARDLAAAAEARGAGVTWELGKSDVVPLRLEFGADGCVLCYGCGFAFFSFEPAGFCHKF